MRNLKHAKKAHGAAIHFLNDPRLPASPGAQGVGIVEAVGPGVQGPIVGTRVIFVDTWNTWREQMVCPVDRLVRVPDGLDDSTAATSYTFPVDRHEGSQLG